MLSAITGEIQSVTDDRVTLAVGPMTLDVLVPAADVPMLEAARGAARTFHTVLYMEGESAGSNLTPRLIGFAHEPDKRFFEKFVTVKGIGPRKALKAMVISAGEIAAAIEGKDARALQKLPAVGKRLAETIVAELSGKLAAFATADVPSTPSTPKRGAVEEDAIAALMALGERRSEAERLLDAVRDQADTVDGLVRAMLAKR
ncbi:MAG: Holliday junction branch migration protein RuvA [Planctomycetota bacterium]